jgi:hypothetical protein
MQRMSSFLITWVSASCLIRLYRWARWRASSKGPPLIIALKGSKTWKDERRRRRSNNSSLGQFMNSCSNNWPLIIQQLKSYFVVIIKIGYLYQKFFNCNYLLFLSQCGKAWNSTAKENYSDSQKVHKYNPLHDIHDAVLSAR